MDHIIEVLLKIIWWPYEAWRHSHENSRLGASELDRETARFWKWVALAITVLLIVGGLLFLAFIAGFLG